MAEEDEFWGRLQYGLKNAPKSGNGFFDLAEPLMWAMGRPSSLFPEKDLNTIFFNQAIARGQNPMSVIPGFGGAKTSASSSTAAKPDPKTDKLTPWYVDWLKTSGVRGLL